MGRRFDVHHRLRTSIDSLQNPSLLRRAGMGRSRRLLYDCRTNPLLHFTKRIQSDSKILVWHVPCAADRLRARFDNARFGVEPARHTQRFRGNSTENYLPLILAQIAVVLLAIVFTRGYIKNAGHSSSRPFIAFLPATLLFIACGKQIVGQPLATRNTRGCGQAGIITSWWGVIVDRAKIRYAHGLYLGGYVLSRGLCGVPSSNARLLSGLWAVDLAQRSRAFSSFRNTQTWDESSACYCKSRSFAPTITRNTFHGSRRGHSDMVCDLCSRSMFQMISHGSDWSFSLSLPWLACGSEALLQLYDSALQRGRSTTVIGLLISAPMTLSFTGALMIE